MKGKKGQRAGWQPEEVSLDRGALQRHAARGLTWTLVESWGSPLLGLVVFAILARLLTEADFGLVALAAVFMFLVATTVDAGLGDALIQREQVTQRTVNTAFWVAVLIAVVMTALGLLLASPIANVLGEPDLAPILQVLSSTFMLSALSSTPMALLRRELAFRQLAIRRLVAVVVGGVIAIALALAGAGAWALVAQHVVNALISVVVLWTVTPWRPGLEVSGVEFRQLFRFGRHVVSAEMLNFLSRHADNLLIGVFLGTGPLGFYAVAYKVLDITQHVLVSAAQKLAFPIFARLQHDRARLVRAYVRITRAVSIAILPGFIGLALVATEAIVIIFGDRWLPSVPAATILFLIGPVLSVQVFSGPLFNSVGHPEVTLRYRFVATVVNVVGFGVAVALFRDITAVAAAFVIRGYLLLPLILVWMRRYAGVPLSAHVAELRTPVAATAVMAVAVVGVKLLLAGRAGTGLLLAAEVFVGAVVFGASLYLLNRSLVREVVGFALQALPGGERARRALRLPSRPDQLRGMDVGADEPHAADA